MFNDFFTGITFTVATFAFFLVTYESYALGGLHLPIANGPNEGMVVCSLLCLVSVIFGPQFWTEPSIISILSRGSLFALLGLLFGVVTCYDK